MLVRRSTMRSQRMRPVIERKFLPSMAALLAFEAVGRLGGIRRAAKELMIDHAVVSRHVRRSEEHTSELQSLMRISYAVFCLKKKKQPHNTKSYDKHIYVKT